MFITRRLTAIASSVVAVMAAIILILGPNIPGLGAEASVTTSTSADCTVHYYGLDEGKETAGAFGPTVNFDPAAPDMTSILAQLKERRECETDNQYDPALVAAHYAVTSNATLPDGSAANLTSQKIALTDMTKFAEVLAENRELYNQVVNELDELEASATTSIETVSKGVHSLYMVPNGNGAVNIKQGLVANDGFNLVLTYSNGAVVKYRLECGFQPNWATPPPDIPVCEGTECSPPPVCPPGWIGEWPNCLEPKWVKPTTVEEGWTPRGLDDGVTDGKVSERQQESGDTRGNAVNDQVNTSTPNTTTPDTKPSNDGGPVAPGANTGGDDQTKSVEQPNSNQNDGGTTGDTEIAVPAD